MRAGQCLSAWSHGGFSIQTNSGRIPIRYRPVDFSGTDRQSAGFSDCREQDFAEAFRDRLIVADHPYAHRVGDPVQRGCAVAGKEICSADSRCPGRPGAVSGGGVIIRFAVTWRGGAGICTSGSANADTANDSTANGSSANADTANADTANGSTGDHSETADFSCRSGDGVVHQWNDHLPEL